MKKYSPVLFSPRLATGNGPAPSSSRLGAGQADGFRSLVLPHLDGAYNLARYLTRDPVLSEDIVQDAFVRAFRAFAQFQGGSARAWLFAIVRNCCRTAVSTSRGTAGLTIHESSLSNEDAARLENRPDPSPTPEDALIQRAEIDRVRAAIEAIPEPFREAVVLRDMEDLSYTEIAEVTGVAIGTVMSRLSRGRSILAKELLPSSRSGDESSRSVK